MFTTLVKNFCFKKVIKVIFGFYSITEDISLFGDIYEVVEKVLLNFSSLHRTGKTFREDLSRSLNKVEHISCKYDR
jgi:hypothetical protein